MSEMAHAKCIFNHKWKLWMEKAERKKTQGIEKGFELMNGIKVNF